MAYVSQSKNLDSSLYCWYFVDYLLIFYLLIFQHLYLTSSCILWLLEESCVHDYQSLTAETSSTAFATVCQNHHLYFPDHICSSLFIISISVQPELVDSGLAVCILLSQCNQCPVEGEHLWRRHQCTVTADINSVFWTTVLLLLLKMVLDFVPFMENSMQPSGHQQERRKFLVLSQYKDCQSKPWCSFSVACNVGIISGLSVMARSEQNY